MSFGYDRRLYILAFDHRGSFQKKMFGIAGEPNEAEAQRIADAKSLIYEGFEHAIANGAPKDAAGILVDEQFGHGPVTRAREAGFLFAMPAERSGQDEFYFQYDDYGSHIESYSPTFTKVLVRWNPDADAQMNARQGVRLAELGRYLHANNHKYLFELLVPATETQLAAVGGSDERYDTEVRPDLMVRAIAEIQGAGIEPDIWKIEGVDSSQDCARIAEQTRAGGRDGVACVVLGRGANDAKVDHWLRAGAVVPGYQGFAIGRSIFWDAVKGWLDSSLSAADAAASISANYRRFIDVYESAAR
jgi:myo-inositol catabolism protein IolC